MIILPDRGLHRGKALMPMRRVSGIGQTRHRITARLHDGHIAWRGWFDDRDDADAFLQALVAGSLHQEPPLWRLPVPGWFPGLGEDVSYDFVTVTFLTTTNAANQTWSVPADWTDTNFVEAIAGGGATPTPGAAANGASGGGGGEYRKSVALTGISPSGSVAFRLEAAAATGSNPGKDCWFNSVAFPAAGQAVGAKGGTNGAVNAAGGAGGTGGYSIGTGAANFNGGAGGTASGIRSGGGGGGAGGPNSVGGAGGPGTAGTNSGGGGGGGAGGGGAGTASVGGTGTNPNGGDGGQNAGGTGSGGVGGATGAGTAGVAGKGGGGGGETGAGGAGGPGTDWDATHGAGAGGGAGGTNSLTDQAGANGGLYGGGASGGASGALGAASGSGAQGIIVVTYTPAAAAALLMAQVCM